MRAVAMLVLGGVLGACSSGTLTFTDENNYSYSSDIAIQSVSMTAGTSPCFDWSGLTTDIRGRAFDGEVDEIYFTQMAQSQAETIAKFENNTFLQADVDAPYSVNPETGDRMVCGEDFEAIGNFFTADDFEVGEDWLVSLMTFRDSPAGGLDPVMSLFVVPDAKAKSTTASVNDDSMTLTITGLDIAGAPRIPVKKGTNTAEWDQVTTDVYGNAFSNQDGDDLFVARFDVASPEEIEDVFLTLDTSAAEIYRGFVKSQVELKDLSSLEATNGETFGGFTDDGVWVFGIACSKCNNPAPLLLAVLEVQ